MIAVSEALDLWYFFLTAGRWHHDWEHYVALFFATGKKAEGFITPSSSYAGRFFCLVMAGIPKGTITTSFSLWERWQMTSSPPSLLSLLYGREGEWHHGHVVFFSGAAEMATDISTPSSPLRARGGKLAVLLVVTEMASDRLVLAVVDLE